MTARWPDGTDVSRETLMRLEIYVDLIRKWNPRINLVSRSSLQRVWDRHIADSLQVFAIAGPFSHWVDIGSGGGLPGLVAAICAMETAAAARFTLIESDQRKCVFLRTVARELGLPVTVLSERIELVPPQGADILSARALADLDKLLGFSQRHLDPSGMCLFPKGATWKNEVEDARPQWRFDCEAVKSVTEPEAAILKIQGVSRD